MKNILLGILAFVAVFLVSCTNSKAETTQITNAQFKTGDIVPHTGLYGKQRLHGQKAARSKA
jgi:hypothetical protein